MKNILQVDTLAFFLYIMPLLICMEKNESVSKSIEELKTISPSSTDKYIKADPQSLSASAPKIVLEPLDDKDLKEFYEITNFLEMNLKASKSNSALANKFALKLNNKSEANVNQSFDLYKMRVIKMRRKKEIIVKKVFEIFPLIGEMLGLADVEKIHLIINKFFLIRETELLAKFITMWDTNVNFTHHSAKVLLNLLLCNSRFNKLRCILNLLMEGLCKGDPRSIRIFKEIVTTVIIDTIMKTNFKYFNDIQAKFNLIRLFNVGFVFSPMVKIQFLEKMLISEKLKELITFMILRLKSKEEIEILMNDNLHQPVPTLINYNETSILHDERMSPKFIGLSEKIIKAGVHKTQFVSEKEVEDFYNLENLLKDNNKLESSHNNKNNENYNKNENKNYKIEANLDFEDKDDVLSLSGSERDPDYDSDLFADNENQNQNLNLAKEEALTSKTKLQNSFTTSTTNNDQKQSSSSIRRIVSQKNNLAINIPALTKAQEFTNSKTLSRSEASKILANLKLECDIRENESAAVFDFKKQTNKLMSNKYFSAESENKPNNLSEEEQINYLETKLIVPEHLPYSEKQKIKLSEIKEQIKNEYNQMLYNMTYQPMPELEEHIPHFQVGISKRTIYPKYKKHLENLLKLNDLLDEFPISLPRGSIDVSSPKAKEAVEPPKPIVITRNVNGVNVSMQFKEKEKEKENNFIHDSIQKSEFRFKSLMNAKSLTASESLSNICLSTTKESDFANKSFQQLANFRYEASSGKPRLPLRTNGFNNAENNFNGENFKNPNNFNDDSQKNSKEIADITENIGYNMPEIKNFIKNPNRNIKVMFPKEIHTTYQVTKHGMKTIEINKDNPTKKMIIERLLPQEAFDDIINQQEKPSKEEDPTGLFNVLKNIQNRKCSCGFLCIEIGAIYGDFSDLNPRNITVPYNTNKNVHFVIKPIVIVNNTAPYGPINPPNDGGNSTNWNNLFLQDEDCDDLKMMGISANSGSANNNKNNNNFNRFKETGMSMNLNKNKYRQSRMTGVNFNQMQRKFYRKVAIAEEIYSQETFKQGLNMIIIQRDKKYTKLFEKTFDTNNSRKDADEMADILRDTPCSKIIILTGIGKWMGAMTPALIKEIKQIGGPDLNNLYSPDEDDNSLADHAFILVGRRGLCRYNGIFRIKNYDLSRTMQKLFPDASSDPNDCFFDDVSLENQKNKLSEKQFFHTIDSRLTLNINNDNRFAWDAPTVSSVSPFRGSIHGGQEIKIGGFNFGSHTSDLKEILLGGVMCGDFINLSPNLISCVTRASTILGPGPKNVLVKLRNGYESPSRTCNVFEYVGDAKDALDDLKKTVNTVNKMRDLPVYMNSNYHDQDISLFDHLKFNNRFYKEKLKPDHSNHVSLKLDGMVKANYNELIDVVNGEAGLKPKMTGLRRKRFSDMMTKLENCEKK